MAWGTGKWDTPALVTMENMAQTPRDALWNSKWGLANFPLTNNLVNNINKARPSEVPAIHRDTFPFLKHPLLVSFRTSGALPSVPGAYCWCGPVCSWRGDRGGPGADALHPVRTASAAKGTGHRPRHHDSADPVVMERYTELC